MVKHIAKDAYRLLDKMLKEAAALIDEEDLRVAFVFRHARNIYGLGTDALFLIDNDRLDACPSIARVILESVFKLLAAVKGRTVAVEILVSECEEEIERIKKWLDAKACAAGIKELETFVNRIRKEHNIVSNKRWTTLACAEAANAAAEYRENYFWFSAYVHATTGGILMQETQLYSERAMHTIITAALSTVAHSVEVIPTTAPQGYIDNATTLLEKLVSNLG